MNKVLVLNAGHTEIPIIEELRKMGCYVVTSGLRGDLPGHQLADQYIAKDYSDKEGIFEIVKKEGVNSIVSCAYDTAIVTAAYVAEKMGWKGHDSYKNTLLLHQKDLFKGLCERLQIPSPMSVGFENDGAAIDYARNAVYPIIVKAVDQASGIGVMKAETYDEALTAIQNAFEKSKEKRIVIEPYIVGTQESFVAFVINGKVVSSMSCNCYSPINPYLIQTETMPSENYDNLRNRLIGIVEMLFSTLGLVDGIITLQYIVKDGEPYIIEMMRRCLGNRFLTPVSAVTGFPWYRGLVMSELGMDCSGIMADTPMAKYAGHHAIMANRNGVYRGTKIPNELMEHVFQYTELFQPGQVVTNYMNERMGYIYYSYSTREELDDAALHFNERIKLSITDV